MGSSITTKPRRLRAAGMTAIAALCLTGAWPATSRISAARQEVMTAPPFLRLLAASIAEGPPFEAAAIANREVRFRWVMAGVPPCNPDRAHVAYDFLLDGRPWQRHGITLEAIPDIKPGARLTVSCDAARGRFVSSMPGAVKLERVADPAGAHAIEVRTRLRELPAVELAWVAVARERDLFTRLPTRGAFGVWRIYERAMK